MNTLVADRARIRAGTKVERACTRDASQAADVLAERRFYTKGNASQRKNARAI